MPIGRESQAATKDNLLQLGRPLEIRHRRPGKRQRRVGARVPLRRRPRRRPAHADRSRHQRSPAKQLSLRAPPDPSKLLRTLPARRKIEPALSGLAQPIRAPGFKSTGRLRNHATLTGICASWRDTRPAKSRPAKLPAARTRRDPSQKCRAAAPPRAAAAAEEERWIARN